MGFSVTLSSFIVLIVVFVISSSLLIVVFQGLRELSYAVKDYLGGEKEKLNVALQVRVDSVNATSCNITVQNTGSETIFLTGQNGFKWNTLIISYGNDTFWVSYPVEDYTILEVRVSGSNYNFNVTVHRFINPGEEARISFRIPYEAPEIPLNGLVNIAFVTHHGVKACAEAVREL